MGISTINDVKLENIIRKNEGYDYQKDLTIKLDNIDSDFDQNIINEIVLWKVNRYALIMLEILDELNHIKKGDSIMNVELTESILKKMLSGNQRGIRLAMASTILRFKNPKVYQIIDQRVYRFMYGQELKYNESDVEGQIQLYLAYLQKLKEECQKHSIDFELADRIFYLMDKEYNKGNKLKGF